ncbi:MAG: Glu-tRNA(Gln) amidotransferase subunit GatE [Methanobacteriaceae archaeon]|jgi:glutamyl-tRNA(Gln) amidotransferase subunit E|nr:Glu-tRNA(Gln) amidotransferase subunit GatE [Candidatus Methanorudis spinitermitis]
MNWNELGLKMGLEIHQQLNTKTKLFCPCAAELVDEKFDVEIKRSLRPTQSELGQIDRAALQESFRKLKFNYEAYDYHTCLVETDDEPPYDINQEALEISMIVACLLNMNIVDEFHTMRKQAIDGSNTGGYQRTGLVATDGYLDTPHGKVTIENLCLEEDAGKIIAAEDKGEDGEGYTHFRLDRLGIPLLEITTDPSIYHPEHVKEVAYALGQILRSTNVKRGIGTIRQDLNISISEGARCEIKGVQNLDLMPKIVENEVIRQLNLIEIKNELEKRNAQVLNEIHDLNPVFENSSSKIISSAESVKGIVLKGFSGLIGKEIQPGRRFGTELASYAKKRGVQGIFHTDELPAYGISSEEVEDMKEYLNVGEDDGIIIVAHDEEIASSSLEEVIRRARMAFDGVVEETRKSLDDGNTEYMRPLPTSSRMYIETDVPSFKIKEESIKNIKNNLPELPDAKIRRIISEYSLSEDLSNQLVRRLKADDFESIVSEIGSDNLDFTTIASVLAYDLREIKREGYDISKINLSRLIDVFKLLISSKISKDAVTEIIKGICKDPQKNPEKIAKDKNLLILGEDVVREIIRNIVSKNDSMIEERKMGALGPLMGMAMKKLKGKVDGKIANKILKEEINALLN